MITKSAARRLLTIASGSLITFATLTSTAFAYPAPDGPDMGGGVPEAPTSTAASSGSPIWVFLVVVAVTAVVAVFATLTILSIKHRGTGTSFADRTEALTPSG
jgi:hypothetical protein